MPSCAVALSINKAVAVLAKASLHYLGTIIPEQTNHILLYPDISLTTCVYSLACNTIIP